MSKLTKNNLQQIGIEELMQDERNLNRHTIEGGELVGKSIRELGLGRSVVVDKNGKLIAGNETQRRALEAGYKKALVVETEGDILVVVKRKDLDLDKDSKARQLALADNATAAANLDWDFEAMGEQADDFGFDPEEWGIPLPQGNEDDPEFQSTGGETNGAGYSYPDGDEGGDLNLTNIVQVQLFLTKENADLFKQMEIELRKHYETDNLTDTVFNAVKAEFERL